MALQKSAENTITALLTDEELDLLEAFAAEQGITDLSNAIPAMIHELVRLHDELWNQQFASSSVEDDFSFYADYDEALFAEHVANSSTPLARLARQALDEHHAGLTEDFDPDDTP